MEKKLKQLSKLLSFVLRHEPQHIGLALKRHHVHLTASRETAVAVGSRHGEPVVIVVQAKGMTMPDFVELSLSIKWPAQAILKPPIKAKDLQA